VEETLAARFEIRKILISIKVKISELFGFSCYG
jgi:hypothetical protein